MNVIRVESFSGLATTTDRRELLTNEAVHFALLRKISSALCASFVFRALPLELKEGLEALEKYNEYIPAIRLVIDSAKYEGGDYGAFSYELAALIAANNDSFESFRNAVAVLAAKAPEHAINDAFRVLLRAMPDDATTQRRGAVEFEIKNRLQKVDSDGPLKTFLHYGGTKQGFDRSVTKMTAEIKRQLFRARDSEEDPSFP